MLTDEDVNKVADILTDRFTAVLATKKDIEDLKEKVSSVEESMMGLIGGYR